MENEGLLEPHTQKLIKIYTTIYKIVFQYSFFAIPLILWLVAAFFLQSKEQIVPKKINDVFKQTTYTYSNGMYIPSRVSDQIWPILNGIWDVKILWWDLQATWNVIIGKNNIVTINDIMLPNEQYVINFDFTWGLDYFSWDYEVKNLIRVLNNWILSATPMTSLDKGVSSVIESTFFRDNRETQQTNMDQILSILTERKYFTNPFLMDQGQNQKTIKWIIQEYELDCLEKPKVFDGFCNKNIEYFIQNLPTIDLEGKWDDIFLISKSLKKKEHVDGFCVNIMYNIFKQPYPSAKLDIIMNGVCNEYNLRYNRIKDFLKVENQLNGIMSDELINTNTTANLFKLTSLRQKIIIQNKKKTFDAAIIEAYLNFFNTLIHQDNMTISQFYIDAWYYFNNVYLNNIIKGESSVSTNSAVKTEAAKLLDKIKSINKWNESVWIKGLERMVKNQELTNITIAKSDTPIFLLQNLQQLFLEYIRWYPEIGIDKAETDTTTRIARVMWTLRYKDEGGDQKKSIIATFDYVDNRFVFSSIRLPDNSALDKVLISFIAHNKSVSFSDVLEFIKSNGDYTPTVITMCDILQWQSGIEVEKCWKTAAIITIEKTRLNITIKDDIATAIKTSNTKRQAYLDKHFEQYGGVSMDSIISTLEKMRTTPTYTAPTEEELTAIEAEKIAIVGKFKQYLKIEPSAIIQKDGKWIVTFDLQWYSFGTVVSIEKNYKLTPLVVQAGGKIISVPSFSITLIPFSKTIIDQFIRDPLWFIKNIDQAAYQKIQELSGAK